MFFNLVIFICGFSVAVNCAFILIKKNRKIIIIKHFNVAMKLERGKMALHSFHVFHNLSFRVVFLFHSCIGLTVFYTPPPLHPFSHNLSFRVVFLFHRCIGLTVV